MKPLPPIPSRAAAAVAALAVGCAAQSVTYQAHVLEAFNAGSAAYPECDVFRINDNGRAIGRSTFQSSYAGLRWDLDRGMHAVLIYKDLNNGNDVVGTTLVDNLETGQQFTIPPLSPLYPLISARAINDQREVVGRAQQSATPQPLINATPFVWDPVNGTRQVVVPDGRELVDVNNAGDAIGHIRRAYTHAEMFVVNVHTGQWTNLSQTLPPNPLATYGYDDEAVAISENGLVVGEAFDGTGRRGFVWDATAGFTFLPGLNGGSAFRVHPSGVNSRGEVVGHAVDGNLDTRAFVWDARNGMRDLNTLTSLPPNIAFTKAVRINEAGWICGSGIDGAWSPPLGIVLRPAFAQTDLGGGGPGNAHLEISGRPLSPGNHADIVLTGAPAATPGVYAISLQNQPVSLLGGTLHANPVLFSIGFVTTPLGANLLYGAVPGGGNGQYYVQGVTLDPATPFGAGFSNAVQVTLLP